MGNRLYARTKLTSLGYLPPGKRDSCRNCASVTIASYTDAGGLGIVYRCPVLKAFVAGGGICPNFTKEKS